LAGDKKEETDDKPAEEDPEVIEARLEQERKRKEKFAKMEADREKTRQEIRDKYSIKKKEDPFAAALAQPAEGSLTKPKKDPASLAVDPDDEGT
jgi:complexin-1/2